MISPKPSETPKATPAKAKKPAKPKTTMAGEATFVAMSDGVYIHVVIQSRAAAARWKSWRNCAMPTGQAGVCW